MFSFQMQYRKMPFALHGLQLTRSARKVDYYNADILEPALVNLTFRLEPFPVRAARIISSLYAFELALAHSDVLASVDHHAAV